MQISTNEFLLGSLGDLLAQQSNLYQLNREIATGQTMLDATSDPAGAGEAIGLAGGIDRLTYDAGNAQAASTTIQNQLGALQRVGTVLDQLQQTALQGANSGNSAATNQGLSLVAQNALQELVQLANSQDAAGNYIFAGSTSGAPPFAMLADGQVTFGGDAGGNSLEVAPSITVPTSLSGANVFMNIPAGTNGVGVTAAAANTGTAYASVQGISDPAALASERSNGTQYAVAFSAGPGGALDYTVTGGIGSPGSAGFAATSTIVKSGTFTPGSDLHFGGLDIGITGTPAAGDQFDVQPAATSSLFQTVQGLISALGSGSSSPQPIQNAIANLAGAQSNILSAQATLGSRLAEIESLQTADGTQSTGDEAQLTTLQSANLPQVIANYSEGVTALQAAEEAFAKIQGLTLFSVIQ
jgi:flagellar hook-associated protein 3 FlgL